jgi:hypothetical protein
MNATRDLHKKQLALWGWHDTRRKSADQTTSPCRINVKGRCDRPDCCCHWPEDPKRFSNESLQWASRKIPRS